MDPDILSVPGGVGPFLFGMLAMTGALRGLGSRQVRAILARSSTSPLTGATSGAVTTAVIQSPSAGAAAALDELHGCLARIREPADAVAATKRCSALLHQYHNMNRLAPRITREDGMQRPLTGIGLHRPALAFGAVLQRAAQ